MSEAADAPFDQSLVPPGLLAVDLDSLTAELGTPLFVYDEDHLRSRCREFAASFGAGNVAYAGKAFLCLAMARLVAEEGLGLDVATGGELHVARSAGFPPERLVFHGNNKSDAELGAARDAGVGVVVADSFVELDRLDRIEFGGDVFVRVTPGVEAHTHEYIETGTDRSKFGFSVSNGDALAAVRRVVETPGLTFGGVHCHIGSQVFRLDSYAKAAAIVVGVRRRVRARDGRDCPGPQPRWRARRALPRERPRDGRRRVRRGPARGGRWADRDGRAGPLDRRRGRASPSTGSGRSSRSRASRPTSRSTAG